MRGLAFVVVFFSLLSLVLKRPFIGILMWFWISLMQPHKLIYGFTASIPYALLVAIVTLGSWMSMHPEEPKYPPRDRITFLLVALAIWVSVTSLTGFGPPDEIIKQWSEAEKMVLMTFVAYAMTNTRERFEQLLLICVLSIAFWGFRGGIVSIVHAGAYKVYGPAGSMIGDNNDLGVGLNMILPLLFYLQYRYTEPHYKWPLRALIGLTVMADLFTYSRGALVALAAMAAVLWLRTRYKVVTGLAIAIALVGILHFAPEQWFHRMQALNTLHGYQQDASSERRLWLWQISWEIIKQHPIVGAGFHWGWSWDWVNRQIQGAGLDPLVKPRAPHSIWFEMLSNHGIIGLALLVAFFVAAAMNAQWLIKRTRGDPDLVWANYFGRMFQAALVGFAVGGSFANLDMYDGFYALVIIGAVARRIVAAELTARNPIVAAPLAGALPAAAAVQTRVPRPLVGT